MSVLKRLTYRREVVLLARMLGLRPMLRKWYYRWARPRDGAVRVEAAGLSARFYARTPTELRMLELAEQGRWERDIVKLLTSRLRPGNVAYDIGSNLGFYAVLLAKVVGETGEVVAFEPESQCYEHLRDNLKLNELTNVRAFRLALGEGSAEGKLYVGEDLQLSNLAEPRARRMRQQIVQIVAGDEIREAKNLPLPQVVKIDVEGHEYAVLRGLRRTLSNPNCETVCCEVHSDFLPQEVKPEQILDLLKSCGFKQFDIVPRGQDHYLLAYKEYAVR